MHMYRPCVAVVQFVQSKRDSYMFYPTDPSQSDGVFAVRWKQFKAHFITKGLAT